MRIGLWKMNNSLLQDTAFVNKIKYEILLNIQTYCTPYRSDFNNIEFMIDTNFLSMYSQLNRCF